MTFRLRILAAFLLFFILTTISIIVYYYQTTTQNEQLHAMAQLRGNAVRALSDMERFIDERQVEVAAIATARVWFDNSSLEYMNKRLTQYRDITKAYDRISLVDLQGIIKADSAGQDIGKEADCQCMSEALRQTSGHDVEFSDDRHVGSVHIYRLVFDLQGRPTGVLIARVPLIRLSELVRGFDIYRQEGMPALKVEMIGADGLLLYSNGGGKEVNRLAEGWPDLKGYLADLDARGETELTVETREQITLIATRAKDRSGQGAPWFLRIEAPKKLLFSEAWLHGREMVIFALLMTLLSATLVWFTASSMILPLEDLARHARALGRGDFSKIGLLPQRSDEFGQLMESFRSMAQRLQKTLDEFRQSEEKFKTVADFTSGWEYWIAPDGSFKYISPACKRLTGYAPEELLADARLLERIIHPDDRASFMKHYADSLAATVPTDAHDELEFRIVTRNGETRCIGHVCRPIIGSEGEYLGRRASNRDITERKQAEQEIQRLNVELEHLVLQRTQELEKTSHELAEFCYAISHELRAPIARIQGFSTALLEECEGQPDRSRCYYVERIARSSTQLRTVIDAILMLSRLSRAEIHCQQVNLSAIAEQLAGEFRGAEHERRLQFVITPDLTVNGDPVLLRICLENLLGNAVKYTWKIDEARIEVGREFQQGMPVYFIRDNGVGFDMAYIDKLFIPFQRLHRVEDYPGTGIGLVTVARIVERHGGRIWAESHEGAGAVFYFTLGVAGGPCA